MHPGVIFHLYPVLYYYTQNIIGMALEHRPVRIQPLYDIVPIKNQLQYRVEKIFRFLSFIIIVLMFIQRCCCYCSLDLTSFFVAVEYVVCVCARLRALIIIYVGQSTGPKYTDLIVNLRLFDQ